MTGQSQQQGDPADDALQDAPGEGVSSPAQPRNAMTHPPETRALPAAERMVVLAAVAGAHGVGGEVRLKLFGDGAAALKGVGPFNDGALRLIAVREAGGGAIARFAEVTDRNAAEALRGTLLTVPRSALPPLGDDEYYHADLIGLPCLSGDEIVGTAVAVDNFGAGDILEIERQDGKRFMVPIAPAVEIGPDTLTIDPDFVEA